MNERAILRKTMWCFQGTDGCDTEPIDHGYELDGTDELEKAMGQSQ